MASSEPLVKQKPIKLAICAECWVCVRLDEHGEIAEGEGDPLDDDGNCANCGEPGVMVGSFTPEKLVRP